MEAKYTTISTSHAYFLILGILLKLGSPPANLCHFSTQYGLEV